MLISETFAVMDNIVSVILHILQLSIYDKRVMILLAG